MFSDGGVQRLCLSKISMVPCASLRPHCKALRVLVLWRRALLQDARILALDEATANVDRTTDALIQTALRAAVRGEGPGGVRCETHT